MATHLIFSEDDRNDSRSIPEIVISRLGGVLRGKEYSNRTEYVIADWVHHVSGSKHKDITKAWKKLKEQMEERHQIDGVLLINQSSIKLRDGSSHVVDTTNEQGLFYIFQCMYFGGQTNDVVKSVRKYLADAGAFVDHARQNPEAAIDFAISSYEKLGKTHDWIQTRLQGMISRKTFTDALKYAIQDIQGWAYGKTTNTVYFGLWGRTTDVLKGHLNLTKNDNLRDNLSRIALNYLAIAEELSASKLKRYNETLTFDQADQHIREIAEFIGQQVKQVEEFEGKDMVTGYPKLTANDDLQQMLDSGLYE
ncbi:MAG: hypothetical protein ACFE0Q_19905 [Anaerolineae bacterium]